MRDMTAVHRERCDLGISEVHRMHREQIRCDEPKRAQAVERSAAIMRFPLCDLVARLVQMNMHGYF